MGYDIRGIVREKHLGGITSNADGLLTKFRRKDVVVLVNTGAPRDTTNYGYGFFICPECGVAEENTPNGKDHFLRHMEVVHNKRIAPERLPEFRRALHAEFLSDVMVIGPFKSRVHAANYMEAIKLGASIELDISMSDIDSFVNGMEENFHVVLFETVPGGSGYIEVLFQHRRRVLEKAREVLKGCSCKKACYQCLLTFWNQPYHSLLDRELAVEVLDSILMAGEVSEVPIPGTRREDVDETPLQSPAEDRFLQIIRSYGLPEPVLQYTLSIHGMLTIPDFAYPDKKVMIYIDGYAYHKGRGEERIELDRRQELILQASGYVVFRIGAKDLDDDEMMQLYLKNITQKLI